MSAGPKEAPASSPTRLDREHGTEKESSRSMHNQSKALQALHGVLELFAVLTGVIAGIYALQALARGQWAGAVVGIAITAAVLLYIVRRSAALPPQEQSLPTPEQQRAHRIEREAWKQAHPVASRVQTLIVIVGVFGFIGLSIWSVFGG